MNKKFLSAILFGALMVTSTGTFVSCKDYDDDIDNLQTQIDKLATKEDMTSQIASLQSALSSAASEAAAAKTAAADALAKATASEKAAAQAALDAAAAKEEAIKAAQDEVAKAKAELEEAIAADFEAVKENLAKQIAELTEKVEEMTGYTTEMVTGLQIQGSSHLDLNFATVSISYPENLLYVNNTEYNNEDGQRGSRKEPSSYTFGEGLTGAITLKNGDVNTTKSAIVVKADPVNAVIAAENLSLINSKNVDVDDYLTYSVAKYNGTLIGPGPASKSAAGTGLYTIGAQLKKNMTSEDFEKFDKLVITGDNHAINVDDCDGDHDYIYHAFAVNDDKGRSVTTDYAVTMHVQKAGIVKNIANRTYLSSDAQNLLETDVLAEYMEGEDAVGDDEGCFPVELGQAFALSVKAPIMASYVVVDYDNAALSVTDKAALKGITVSGVDAVKGTSHTMAISGTYAAGIAVPLKLVTVDYTGNVEVFVFWVKAGEPAMMTAAFTVTPTKNVTTPIAWPAESTMEEFKVPAGTTKYSLVLEIGESAHQEPEVYTENDAITNINNGALKLYESDKETLTTTVADVAYAKFVGELNLQVMREDKVYGGIIKFYDATGTYLGSNEITVKKVLPTTIPAGLTAKTNAIQSDGTLKVYPKAVNGAGVYDLANAFNFTKELKADEYLNFVEANGFKYNDVVWAVYDNAARTIKAINGETIGKDTKYPTTVTYNYGDIKYHPEGHGVADPGNYEVTWATKFDVVFACYPVESTYAWYTAPTVYYNEEITIFGKDDKGNDKYNFLTVKNPYGMKTDAFDSANEAYWTDFAYYLNSTECQKIELWTNGDKTKVNEFFIPTYVADSSKPATGLNLKPNPNSVNTVLSGDVETTVVIYVVDKFGHEHAIEALTFTMKKDHTVAE